MVGRREVDLIVRHPVESRLDEGGSSVLVHGRPQTRVSASRLSVHADRAGVVDDLVASDD